MGPVIWIIIGFAMVVLIGFAVQTYRLEQNNDFKLTVNHAEYKSLEIEMQNNSNLWDVLLGERSYETQFYFEGDVIKTGFYIRSINHFDEIQIKFAGYHPEKVKIVNISNFKKRVVVIRQEKIKSIDLQPRGGTVILKLQPGDVLEFS